MNHRYDLVRLDHAEQTAEIDKCTETVTSAIGVRPKGFRAPGYNVDPTILDLLSARGYLYDSSVFACPAYYAAKAATIGINALKGRRSASLMGDMRVLTAPNTPYRVGAESVWSKGRGIVELPITVVTRARVPMLGTALSLMGRMAASSIARFASKLSFVNIELHGIDFADAGGDGIGYMKEYQIELRTPLTRRRQTLERVVSILLDSGLEPVTLLSAAERSIV